MGDHTCGFEGHKSCVALVPIFNHLEDEHMAEITKAIQSDSYKKGEMIYRAGDQSYRIQIHSILLKVGESEFIVYRNQVRNNWCVS